MDLTKAEEGKEYIVKQIATDDEELDAFLFSLGCYSGEAITVVSRRRYGLYCQGERCGYTRGLLRHFQSYRHRCP